MAAINAVNFGVYGVVRRSLDNPNSIKSQSVAGMAAGLDGVGVVE